MKPPPSVLRSLAAVVSMTLACGLLLANPAEAQVPVQAATHEATVGPLALAAEDIENLAGPWQNLDPDRVTAASTLGWCDTVLPRRKLDDRRARQMMTGYVDMGQYGYFNMGEKPSWGYRSTMDSSGNGHLHGLHWAVPLLRTGMQTGDQKMVDRFLTIVKSWLKRYPMNKNNRPGSAKVGIVAGERLWALTCAAEAAPTSWIPKRARQEAKAEVRRFTIKSGTNNVALHSQMGAMAVLCAQRGKDAADKPRDHLKRLADYLVLPDGSDREGSPHYAYYTRILLTGAQRIFEVCGGPGQRRLREAVQRSEPFLAMATKPDFRLVTLGDTARSKLAASRFDAASPALFAASEGRYGTPPQDTYRTYQGGYVLGRSGSTPNSLFYSIRSGRGPSPTAHSHNDVGSATFQSEGVEWLGDPGPYRYSYGSAMRQHVVSRAAHNAISAQPLPPKKGKKRKKWQAPRSSPSGQLKSAQQTAAIDTTCLKDRTYPTLKIRRCVAVNRQSGTFVVTDKFKAKAKTRFTQRWQIPPGVTVTKTPTGATLSANGSEQQLNLTGTVAAKVKLRRAKSSHSRGWFTGAYGKRLPGTQLARATKVKKGEKVTWTSAVIPQ